MNECPTNKSVHSWLRGGGKGGMAPMLELTLMHARLTGVMLGGQPLNIYTTKRAIKLEPFVCLNDFGT